MNTKISQHFVTRYHTLDDAALLGLFFSGVVLTGESLNFGWPSWSRASSAKD